jgi:hypothetical protein
LISVGVHPFRGYLVLICERGREVLDLQELPNERRCAIQIVRLDEINGTAGQLTPDLANSCEANYIVIAKAEGRLIFDAVRSNKSTVRPKDPSSSSKRLRVFLADLGPSFLIALISGKLKQRFFGSLLTA